MDDAELVELLDDARTAGAMAARRGRRVAGQVAREGATLAGVLVDLAERGATVALATSAGTTTRGPIVAVGWDVVVVGDRWIRLAAIVSVRPDDGPVGGPGDDERGVRTRSMRELLAGAAPDAPALQLVLVGGSRIGGRLVSVGDDVIALVADAPDAPPCYVSTDSIVEVLRSG